MSACGRGDPRHGPGCRRGPAAGAVR